MKVIPATIATAFGIAFLWVELAFNYYPPVPTVNVDGLLETPEQSKARAAVMQMLLYPEAGAIDDLRTVKSESAQYVCGKVNGKTRSGSYAGSRNFVYDVAGDFAAIDDDDQIVRSHRAFHPCPEDDKPMPLVIDLDKVNKLAKALPKPDVQIATSFGVAGGGNSAAGSSNNQDLRQGIEGLKRNADQHLGQSSSSPSGSQSVSSAAGSVAPGRQSKNDQPPRQWPKFSPDDPLSKPGAEFTESEAMELASDIERRWQRFADGKSASRPSVNEIEEAQRALLTIKEQSPQFPQAWAAFVRLQKLRQDAT